MTDTKNRTKMVNTGKNIMTNSIRHSPFFCYCGGSNAKWKRAVSREVRRTNRILVKLGKEPRSVKEESDIWCSPQDGSWTYFIDYPIVVSQKRPRGKRLKVLVFQKEWHKQVIRK